MVAGRLGAVTISLAEKNCTRNASSEKVMQVGRGPLVMFRILALRVLSRQVQDALNLNYQQRRTSDKGENVFESSPNRAKERPTTYSIHDLYIECLHRPARQDLSRTRTEGAPRILQTTYLHDDSVSRLPCHWPGPQTDTPNSFVA